MAENKTKPTDASVEDYIASRANAQQRTDCRVDGSVQESHPVLTKNVGTSIVGYGSYRYTYESGRTGKPLWQALPSVTENWWSTWWLKERSKDPCCPSLASTRWARLACTSSSLLILIDRRSKSLSVRSRK